jgi:hypothetical protein
LGRGMGTSRLVRWGNGRLQSGRPGLSLIEMTAIALRDSLVRFLAAVGAQARLSKRPL